MKKAILLTAALVVIASPAMASDLDSMIEGHNINCEMFGAQKLTGEPIMDGEMACFRLEGIEDVFFIDTTGEVISFACVCTDSDQLVEFLAQCVTACFNFGGTEAGNASYEAILSELLSARAGNESKIVRIPGLAIQIRKQDFGYSFLLARVS